MIVFIFILCLNILITLFSSTISGYIFAYTRWSFYKIYSCFLFCLILFQLIEIHGRLKLSSFFQYKWLNIIIIVLTFILVVIEIRKNNFLALSAVLEEGIYRIIAVPYFLNIFKSPGIVVVLISIIFMFNHIYIIYISLNRFKSFLILLILNICLILLAMYVNVWVETVK